VVVSLLYKLARVKRALGGLPGLLGGALTDRFRGRGYVSGTAMVGAESAGCARWPAAVTIVGTFAHFGL
jgi:hypothetical protein